MSLCVIHILMLFNLLVWGSLKVASMKHILVTLCRNATWTLCAYDLKKSTPLNNFVLLQFLQLHAVATSLSYMTSHHGGYSSLTPLI